MLNYYLSLVTTEEEKEKITYIYQNFFSFMCVAAGKVLIHSPHDVEDVVHDSMLKIIEIIDKIDISDPTKARNMCMLIAKHKAVDYCKLKDNQNAILDDTLCTNLKPETEPSELLIQKDTMDNILKAVISLDDKYKDICYLKFVHNLKEPEIASLLDIPPKTVGTRIYRGKQILRDILKKEGTHV